MSIINLSEQSLKYSDRPALVGAGECLNWRSYHYQVAMTARALQRLGIRKNDAVIVLTRVDQTFPVLFLALLSLKAIVVPLQPDQPEAGLRAVARIASCRWLIDLRERQQLSTDLSLHMITSDQLQEAKSHENISQENEQPFIFSSEQVATILFTSGSSGHPKGFRHTIGNHYFSALGANSNMPLDSNDRWLIVLPFFHVSGIAILFRTLISAACAVIGDTRQRLAMQLRDYQATHISLVPTQLRRLLDEIKPGQNIPSLKAVLTGGSKCPTALTKRALAAGLPLFLSYGSTEMASQITTAGPEELREKPGSSGKVLPYRTVKIAENGEILVGGKTIGRPLPRHHQVARRSCIQAHFPTGDSGKLDASGSLYVTGRLDNMFISGGENIYPEEIENALLSLEKVLVTCVVAVPDPDFGSRPVAFIQPKPGESFDEKYLRTGLEKLLPHFKIPARFIHWEPEEGQLKPDRKFLRQRAIKG